MRANPLQEPQRCCCQRIAAALERLSVGDPRPALRASPPARAGGAGHVPERPAPPNVDYFSR